jgi:predicted nucleic acid-binding Zn ribbon protein
VTTWRPLEGGGDSEPRRLSESLDRVTRRLGGPAASVFSSVFSGWEAIVGPDIAVHAKPQSLKKGVLVLAVDHPAWATQLRYMTADLLTRIWEVTGAPDVREIHLRVIGPETRNRGRFGRS